MTSRFLSIVALLLLLTSCKESSSPDRMETADTPENKELSLAEQVAEKYGRTAWKDVTELDFTFNVARNGDTISSRAWSWRPKTNDVRLVSRGDTVSYKRSNLGDSLALSTDRGFINDVYWLLPHFKLVWDEDATISYPKPNLISISYGEEGGYTPGDRYDITIDDQLLLTSWDYLPAGKTEPVMSTSFTNYKEIGGLLFA
ncbi:MAG: hypothetical protein WBA16_08315 [Nonlabens sp.]